MHLVQENYISVKFKFMIKKIKKTTIKKNINSE